MLMKCLLYIIKGISALIYDIATTHRITMLQAKSKRKATENVSANEKSSEMQFLIQWSLVQRGDYGE
jgi:hypothetical protein